MKNIAFAILAVLLIAACENSPKPDNTTEIPATGNKTINELTKAITASPTDDKLYHTRALVYYEAEGYDEAIVDLNKAISIDSLNADYYHLLADVYLDYYQSSRALYTIKQVIEIYPKRIPSLLKLSEFQFILKQYEESKKTIGTILQIDPFNAEAYFMLGMNFKEEKDTVRAINSFQTAVENESDLLDGWVNLGILYGAKKNPLASRYFDNALRINPHNTNTLYAKAYFLQNINRFSEAIEIYREIVKVDPQNSNATFNTGYIYYTLDSLDKAYYHFDICVKNEPTGAIGYYYRGLAAQHQGKKEQARKDFEQTLNLDPTFERATTALQELK